MFETHAASNYSHSTALKMGFDPISIIGDNRE
jgi:hypothetical protein